LKEVIIALSSSAITILVTSLFNYYFNIGKEIRLQSISYKSEILTKVYIPVLKELDRLVILGEGYERINEAQLLVVEKIINNNYELVDVELDTIMWNLKEDVYSSRGKIDLFDDCLIMY